MDPKMDPRVVAIRVDVVVGKGSCSNIDECCEDRELVVDLDRNEINDPKEAVRYARKAFGLYLERGLDQRWGEEDDEQLTAWNKFKADCEANPVA